MTWTALAPSDGLYNATPTLLTQLLAREIRSGLIFDSVLIVGPTMSGKSTLLAQLPHTIADRPIVKWDAGLVLEHVFGRKLLDERLLGRLKRIENDVVGASRDMYHNTIVVKTAIGLNSTLRSRETASPQSTILIVTIGPPEGLYERLMAYEPFTSYHTMSEAQVASQAAEIFALPKRNEKFAKIIYINTFGQEGVEWLSKKIEIKKHD